MHLRDSADLRFSSRIVTDQTANTATVIKSHKVTTLSRFQVDTLAKSSIQLNFELFDLLSNFA